MSVIQNILKTYKFLIYNIDTYNKIYTIQCSSPSDIDKLHSSVASVTSKHPNYGIEIWIRLEVLKYSVLDYLKQIGYIPMTYESRDKDADYIIFSTG